ncbi:SDR family NAD(P)-dependent oxidoreductase [Chryseobacterium sp. LC2016-27]|uniref:SDR family NAD(P)-dependent oxidoreductase n=1 Tax=Chryseobacterium sp. LC2016-27 TaxID=2897326 RepID=UPI001E4A9D62|nr:SDR family NAD(P)-dependent oxidoreductase [Chryseobacterium sp. LC2016-27]MCD0456389.1 SDR family NAD(P)-dependent oxidoreductase [Chryseobacterium sp. LC2016-27]
MKTIVIIGAGPGLGYSVAQLFGSRGFKVSLIGRNEERLKDEVRSLQSENITADYAIADAANGKELSFALTSLGAKEDLPDVILYNAFSYVEKNLENESWDSIKNQLDVNVGGAFNLLKEVLPVARKTGKGKLFFTGGGFAIDPQPNFTGLSIGKAALKNLLGGTAKSVEETDIHIASVVICGTIGGEDPKYSPDRIAENYWDLYIQERAQYQEEIIY